MDGNYWCLWCFHKTISFEFPQWLNVNCFQLCLASDYLRADIMNIYSCFLMGPIYQSFVLVKMVANLSPAAKTTSSWFTKHAQVTLSQLNPQRDPILSALLPLIKMQCRLFCQKLQNTGRRTCSLSRCDAISQTVCSSCLNICFYCLWKACFNFASPHST